MERRLIDGKGNSITIRYVERWGDDLMTETYKDGGIHIMFIKVVDKESEMLKGEERVEVKG
jgi:hypothetical protein